MSAPAASRSSTTTERVVVSGMMQGRLATLCSAGRTSSLREAFGLFDVVWCAFAMPPSCSPFRFRGPAARCRRRLARATGRGRPAAVRRHRRFRRPPARRRPRPGARRHRRRVRVPRDRAIARRRPDAVDAGRAARPRRRRRLRPLAERRRRRRLPATSHRRVRDRARHRRLQRRAPAPCGATTASRHMHRRAPTYGPFSTAAGQLSRNMPRPRIGRSPVSEADVRTVIECAVQGAIPQRVRIPPGNCRSSR